MESTGLDWVAGPGQLQAALNLFNRRERGKYQMDLYTKVYHVALLHVAAGALYINQMSRRRIKALIDIVGKFCVIALFVYLLHRILFCIELLI